MDNEQNIRTGAAAAERDRIAGILDHDHAAGRQKMARHLAFSTDMPVEMAVAMLAVAASEAPPIRIPSLAERAAECGEFGGDGGQPASAYWPSEKTKAQARQNRIVAATNGETK